MNDRPKAPEGRGQKRARSAVDRWNHAVREAYAQPKVDPDARAVLEASDEEIERQLREAGVDLAAEDAKADATYEAAVAKFGRDHHNASALALAHAADMGPPSTAGARVVSIRSRGRRFVEEFPYYAAAAGVIGAIVGQSAGFFGQLQVAKPDRPDQVTPAPVDPIARAKALRERAATECAKKEWEKCRATLTEALKLDEDGNSSFEVQSLVHEANEGIATKEFEDSRMRPRK